MTIRHFTSVAFAVSALLLPIGAAAQTPAPAQTLHVETIDNGFVIAPDARFTKVNGDFASLAGVYGGWLTDRTLLVGAGGYWLTNRDRDFKMQYGGGVVRWTFGGHRKLGVSAGALVGMGDATLSRTYGDLFGDAAVNSSRFVDHGRTITVDHGRTITSDTRLWINDTFFIAEPQVSAVWSLTRWMRLDAGVGYRAIGASDLLEAQLRGASGSIGLQFGGR